MFVGHLLQALGQHGAVDNARVSSIELSKRRVEHEAVEIFLERLAARRLERVDTGPAVADR